MAVESVREWTTRYALWSGIHSVTGIAIILAISLSVLGGAYGLVLSPALALFIYVFGIPAALVVSFTAAHLLVSVPALRNRPAMLRPVFAGCALVLGPIPLGAYVLGEASIGLYVLNHDALPLVVGAAAVVANVPAVWRVWHRLGPAPGT